MKESKKPVETDGAIIWYEKPKLNNPIFLATFEGWNDAGDAGSDASNWILNEYDPRLIGEISGEDYLDYQQLRPNIIVNEEGIREVSWPSNEISLVSIPGSNHDIIILNAFEPNYKWKSFSQDVIKILTTFNCEEAFTFGSLLAEVPHTRPTRLTGIATDKDRLNALEVLPSNYQGPTGIVGILHAAFQEKGINSTSLWAAVPHYVTQSPQPSAINELLNTFGALIGIDFDTSLIALRTQKWVDDVSEAIEDDDEASSYVADLEERFDAGDISEGFDMMPEELPNAGSIVSEVEQFLRDQPDEK
ncbi:MAG: PAC2 family protein [Acidimicrobiia bacterium]|nr:PAC2 family protein [Acidimicrobiia bacterium]